LLTLLAHLRAPACSLLRGGQAQPCLQRRPSAPGCSTRAPNPTLLCAEPQGGQGPARLRPGHVLCGKEEGGREAGRGRARRACRARCRGRARARACRGGGRGLTPTRGGAGREPLCARGARRAPVGACSCCRAGRCGGADRCSAQPGLARLYQRGPALKEARPWVSGQGCLQCLRMRLPEATAGLGPDRKQRRDAWCGALFTRGCGGAGMVAAVRADEPRLLVCCGACADAVASVGWNREGSCPVPALFLLGLQGGNRTDGADCSHTAACVPWGACK